MTRTTLVSSLVSFAALVALGAGSGCKGDTVVKPDPQTQADLERCQKDKVEKDKLIKDVEAENARLMREKGSGAEIVVSIEGSLLTVKPGAPRRGPSDRRQGGRRGVQRILQPGRQVARRDPEVLRAGAQEGHRPAGADGDALGVGELHQLGPVQELELRAVARLDV